MTPSGPIRPLALAAALALTAASPLVAAPGGQEPPPSETKEEDKPKVTFAETMIVTASRAAEDIRDAPVAVTVLKAEDIARSGADNYADLLRRVPGLNAMQASARDVNLTPRLATGRNARATLALLDGRTIYQDYFGMVLWDLLPINFDEIKQIEIIRGPDSALWGANALGGVINIITKAPSEMLGTSVKIGGGQLGTREASAVHAGVSGPLGYKIGASYFKQDAWERPTTLPDGTPLPPYENTGTHQYKADLRLDVDRDPSQWRFDTGFASSDGASLTALGPFDSKNLSQGHASAGYRRADVHVDAYLNIHDAKYRGFLTPDVVTIKNQTAALEGGGRRSLGTKHLVSYGATARYSHFDISLVPDVHDRKEVGAYVEDEVFLTEKLRLRLGARFDWFDTLGGALSPRTGLVFKPHPDHTLRASYNHAYVAPSLVEDFLDFHSTVAVTLPTGPYSFPILATGHKDLGAETMNAFEGGYTGILAQRVTIGLSLYYNVSRDRIFFVPVEVYTSAAPPPGWPLPASALDSIPLPKTFSYRNLARIVDRGFEVSADARVTSEVLAFANYSYQAEPQVSEQGPVPVPINLPPKHRINVGVSFAKGGFFGSASVNRTTSAFWADVQPYTGTTPAFTLLNAAMGVKLGSQVTVAVKGVNLAGERIQQHLFGDILGRRITAELRFRI